MTGLGLKATVAPPPAVDGLPWVMGGASWEVSGPIGLLGGLPLLCLAADPGAGLEVAGYQFSFGLTLATAPVAVPTPPAPGVQSVLQLDAAHREGRRRREPLKLPFRARLTASELDVVAIASDLPRAPESVRAARGAAGGRHHQRAAASTALPALDDISLEERRAGGGARLEVADQRRRDGRLRVAAAVVAAGRPDLDRPGRVGVLLRARRDALDDDADVRRIELGGGYLDATIDLPRVSFAANLDEAGQRIDIARAREERERRWSRWATASPARR